ERARAVATGQVRYGQVGGGRRCENGWGPAGRASGGGVTMKAAQKGTQKSAKSTTAIGKTSKGFTEEERVAMKERVQELKAAARRGPREDKADGESAVLAKIAGMPEPDRAMGKRLHAIVKASAPALSP